MSKITSQVETRKDDRGKARGAAHWRSKIRREPLEPGQALRQGRISNCAFIALGREQAIAFLNADNVILGGRPLTIATASVDGEKLITREIERLRTASSGPTTPTAKDVS